MIAMVVEALVSVNISIESLARRIIQSPGGRVLKDNGDNEDGPLPILITDAPDDPAPEPFALEQMVRCDECLRANPPTRVNCIYCGGLLPLTETTVNLQKPALRPLEKWEQGYNNILLPPTANLTDENRAEAADLLRLGAADLDRILSSKIPLPLARAATIDEATLVQRRLSNLGIKSDIMPDPESAAAAAIKVRALEIDDDGINAYQTPETPGLKILWVDVLLLVVGRVIVKRVELKEQKSGRSQNRILESSEFATDETVVDVYTTKQTTPYRIKANSFDFTCLGTRKGLLASENISTLLRLLCDHAPQAGYDDSFNSVRKSLEAVWPSEQQSESSGWRRERPGKYTVGSVAELSNETQFQRYSRLRYHFQMGARTRTDDDA